MTPKSEDILKVINNFKSILPSVRKYIFHLNMMEPRVNGDSFHPCGTVHCHGGWYAIAACDLKQRLGYMDGAVKMARDLGFEGDNDKVVFSFMYWVRDNPGLWGNEYGYNMFRSQLAFFNEEKRPKGAFTVGDIVDHWTEVYERVKALEIAQFLEEHSRIEIHQAPPIYDDITAQLAVLPTEETTDIIPKTTPVNVAN